ncbi:MAG: hypothetical protein JW904_09055 [Spirochaetales bacterium]|nr:hypothetical protein [Spirochaetales bacterium]
MIYDILTQSPYPWILFAGIFCGSAASRLTRSVKKSKHPDKARERKAFWVMLGFSAVIALLLLAVFVPGSGKIMDWNLLYMFAGTAVLFFLVFRFKKAGGIPFIILAGLLVVTVILFLQAITAFTGETEIGQIKVLSSQNSKISCEFTNARKEITRLEMEGTYIGAEIKTIVFNDFYVFLGQKTWYRFTGLKTAVVPAGSEMTREKDIHEFAHPEGISEALYRFVSANIQYIPGIKTNMIQISYVQARPLTTYSIRIQNDSGAEIVAVSR